MADAQLPVVTHYTAYQPRPFTRDQRETTTILFGGLTWKHERLVQGVLQNLGFDAEPLPATTRADLDAGKELVDVGACCPTLFTTGNLASFLRREAAARGAAEVADRYVFLTAGSCGPCRFGQYHESYAAALDGLGLRDLRILLLAQDRLDQGPSHGGGLDVNPPLSLGLILALLTADVLADLEYLTRPYEVVPGRTDAVLKESVERLHARFRRRPPQRGKLRTVLWHVLGDYFTSGLRELRALWDAVEVDRLQSKPRVKITGEFWLQTHEGEGNYDLKRWLEREGAEVVPPPVAVWLDYLLDPVNRSLQRRRRGTRSLRAELGARALAWLHRATHRRLRAALGDLASALPDQAELRRLAAPYYHHQLEGGEGHMLVAKALHAWQHRKAHMICELSPYGCLPNTMSVGAMANVLGKHPDLLYAPIEVKGDAEVHALSRCQMILTEARQRAHGELEAALEATGLTVERIRAFEAEHPETRRATYRVPHRGYRGSAANYVAHLARDRGLAPRRAVRPGARAAEAACAGTVHAR